VESGTAALQTPYLGGHLCGTGKRYLEADELRQAVAALDAEDFQVHIHTIGDQAVRDALDYGVKVTGVTVHLVDAGTDTGPILAQQAVPVLDDDDEETLHERIKVAERRLLVDVLAAIATRGLIWTGRKAYIR